MCIDVRREGDTYINHDGGQLQEIFSSDSRNLQVMQVMQVSSKTADRGNSLQVLHLRPPAQFPGRLEWNKRRLPLEFPLKLTQLHLLLGREACCYGI